MRRDHFQMPLRGLPRGAKPGARSFGAAALWLGALVACSDSALPPSRIVAEPAPIAGGQTPGAGDAGAVAAGVVDGFDSEWPRVPTMGSGTAGYAAGSWSYEDYVYDSTAGASGNSGDLAVLQIALTDEAVRYVAKLNSYIAEDPTLVALAVDTDCNAATGGGAWPNGSGVSTDGWEFLVQAGDAGARVFVAGKPTTAIRSAANPDTNVVEFDVPRSFADPASKAADGALTYQHWCYRGLVGLGSDTWSQTTNVLFRNRLFDQGSASTDENDSADTFQTDRQVAALQSGDFTGFRREVDFNLIASRAAVVPQLPAKGNQLFTRIYDTPDFPNQLPEGAHQGENSIKSPLYNGRFQPYSIYVPQSYRDDPRPAPMLPMLHGITANHRNHGWAVDGGAFWADVVQANRMILPFPFGRGEESWYEHVGEVDVLAVIDDVKKHFNIDASKQFLSGASMGGLGALKIAQEHPDLFAGLVLAVPPMSDRTQGYAVPQNNEYDLVELAGSLRNIPVLDFYGELDPIVPPAANSERFCERLAALQFDHDCWLDMTGSHSNFYDARFAELKHLVEGHHVIRNPAHVTFQVHPAFRQQAEKAGVADLLRYDSAYWISNIAYPPLPADSGEDCDVALPNNMNPCTFPSAPGTPQRLEDGAGIATIDVRTYGTGEGDPVPTTIRDDPSPILVRQGTSLSPGEPVEPKNAFDLRAENVVAFDLDLGRMGLTVARDLSAKVSGNGLIRLGLNGVNRQCAATLNGAEVPVVRAGNRLEMALNLQQTDAPDSLRVHCPD